MLHIMYVLPQFEQNSQPGGTVHQHLSAAQPSLVPQQLGNPYQHATGVHPVPVPQFDPLANVAGHVDPTRRAFGRLRELKLKGQIGEQGEEGKLSYSSLSFQIYSARS